MRLDRNMIYRIMIVEDDEVISSATAKHIEKWGFEHGSFPKDYNIRDFINTDVAKIAFPDNVTIE